MSWRETLQPASFRGEPFLVEAHDSAFGRRLVVHEYPNRDVPYAEDLGRKARRFSLTAFVVGEEYQAQRDRLLEAVEQSGPGTLVHPYLGSLEVVIEACQVKETLQDGRMAKFSLTCIEAGHQTFPSQAEDTKAVVKDRAALAATAVQEDFTQSFNTEQQPDFVTNDAETALGDALQDIKLAGRGVL